MEVNTILKNVSRVSSRVAYVYPSTYRAMISSLAPDIIYFLLNSMDDVYVERFSCSSLYGAESPPRSFETGSPLKDFKLILTSLHYEPDIVNLARILLAANISVLAEKRHDHVIVAGGPACIENPVPYSDVVDVCIIGEAEATLPEVIHLWLEYSDSKKKFLEEVASLPYAYVPSLREECNKAYVEDLDKAFYPIRQVENIHVEPVYGRGYKLEVSRGCLFWCSFCIESRAFQPYRERSYSTLRNIVEKGIEHSTSGKRVVLYALAFPVSFNNVKLLEYLAGEMFKASLPSLRVTPMLEKSLELIKMLGQKTLSIAPESFSGLVQSVLFKYTQLVDYVINNLKHMLDYGFDLKLYVIYGFKGLESRGVLEENVKAIRELASYAKSRGKKVKMSLNPLVPKPHTLFQHVGMMTREELVAVLREYKILLRGLVEYRPYDIDWAIAQAQIALSTKPLGKFIVKWAEHGGGLSGWRRALKELNVNYKYVFTGYSVEEELPWSRIKLSRYVEKVSIEQYYVYKKLASIQAG